MSTTRFTAHCPAVSIGVRKELGELSDGVMNPSVLRESVLGFPGEP